MWRMQPTETNAGGSACDSERWISFLICNRVVLVECPLFVCRLPRIIKIVTVGMMHDLFDNYLLCNSY